MSNVGQKFKDRYWRILLTKELDDKLMVWLLRKQRLGERPNAAIKRALYELKRDNPI